MTCIKLTGNRH